MKKVTLWQRIRVWLHDSEVVAWSRLQLLVGAVWTVLMMTDLSSVLPANWLPYWLILSGIVTEYARRAREPHDLGVKTVADLDAIAMPIKTDDKVVVDKMAGTVTVTKAAEMPAGVATKEAGEKAA